MLFHLVVSTCMVLSSGMVRDKAIKQAKKKGLKGYNLVDAVDPWWGFQEPEVGLPHKAIDKLGNGDGKVTKADWKKIGLPDAHFNYFDNDKDGRLDKHEASSWWMQRRSARDMNVTEVNDPPRGHLQKLGAWKDPLPSSDLEYTKPYPHPRDFWRKHMDGYLPANLKGAQHGWPAMEWTKETLAERFGWVDAKLEPKIEGRSNNTAYKDLDQISPRHRLNVSDYLRLEEGKNIYVVSIIAQAMAWEVAHPSVLLCGSRRIMLDKDTQPYKLTKHEYPHEANYSWMTHVFEANLWIGSGRTRSQFHFDKEWNVNCLLSGRKRWVFINPFWYDEDINWARGKKFVRDDPLNNRWTDWVYLDPDRVDLIVQHKLRKMDYWEMIQEPGDCIFIPYAMLHQVEKLDDGLQMAASWMFLPETVYSEEDCAEAPLDRDLPLAAMDTLYMYSGKGIIPQGYVDPLSFVRQLRGEMKSRREKHLSLKTFTRMVTQGDAILRTVPDRKTKIQKLYDMITAYAKSPKKGLMPTELNKVPLRIWAKPASEGDNEGPLPCDHGEEYHIRDDAEFLKMKEYVDKELEARTKGSERPGAGKIQPLKNTRIYPGLGRVGEGGRPKRSRKEEL